MTGVDKIDSAISDITFAPGTMISSIGATLPQHATYAAQYAQQALTASAGKQKGGFGLGS